MRSFAAIFLTLALTCSLAAQTADTTSNSNSTKPKAKRVWTDDDIKKLKGPISVVGDTRTTPADKPKPDVKSGDSSKTAATVPSEPKNDECVSEDWAAAIAMVGQAQGATLDANYWSMKLFGGACLTTVKPQAVAARLNGDYVLDDGSKLRINSDLFPTLPPTIIATMADHKPFAIGWKGGAYVVTFVEYVDQVVYDGGGQTHIYYPSKLTLTGPRSGRTVIFDVTKNNASELDGSITLAVSSRQ